MAARYRGNYGNAQLARLLKSPRLSSVLTRHGRTIAARYKASVPRRTDELASKVYVRTAIGGLRKDRYVARVEATARHAAPMEFGWVDKKGRAHKGGHYMKRASRGGG